MPSPSEAHRKTAATDQSIPRLLCDTRSLIDDAPDQAGALWKLAEQGRQLDANVVRLPPSEHIGLHAEPDLDVLLLVLAGDGVLGVGTAERRQHLSQGALLWLPHGSTRSITAGDDGLVYLTVHQRRPGMRIRERPRKDS